MNIDFVVNDYLLAWYLLFKPSYSDNAQKFKEKLWKNYKKQYTRLEKENIEILKYNKDFIPDDDTIYNIVFDTDIFKELKKETTKYRHHLMEIWDKNSKLINKYIKDDLKLKDIPTYHIICISNKLNIVEFIKANPSKNISWGKKENIEDPLISIIHIIYTIIKYELADYNKEYKDIVTSILDLAINNELYTRISKVSHYNLGASKLSLLRKQLYPYWLMFLGCDKEELITYMMRDQLPFDIDKYQIERGLRKVSLYEFIDFCCKNIKYFVKVKEEELEII